MLTKSGAKLLDFGLAKATQAAATNITVSAAISTTDQKMHRRYVSLYVAGAG